MGGQQGDAGEHIAIDIRGLHLLEARRYPAEKEHHLGDIFVAGQPQSGRGSGPMCP